VSPAPLRWKNTVLKNDHEISHKAVYGKCVRVTNRGSEFIYKTGD